MATTKIVTQLRAAGETVVDEKFAADLTPDSPARSSPTGLSFCPF
jgi:hypothetical protein